MCVCARKSTYRCGVPALLKPPKPYQVVPNALNIVVNCFNAQYSIFLNPQSILLMMVMGTEIMEINLNLKVKGQARVRQGLARDGP